MALDLGLVWWEETRRRQQSISGTVDPHSNALSARINHLSVVAHWAVRRKITMRMPTEGHDR